MEYVNPATSFKCDGCGGQTHWLVSLRFRSANYEGGTSELCTACARSWMERNGSWPLFISEFKFPWMQEQQIKQEAVEEHRREVAQRRSEGAKSGWEIRRRKALQPAAAPSAAPGVEER